LAFIVHRGRIQAQGGGIEKSVSWVQEIPPTREEGLNMIDTLENRLSPSEAKIRTKAFEKARIFVNQAAKNGGIDAQISKSFRVKGTKDIRVDIEVITGKAFI
jgi:hypothetical protein